MHHMVNKTRGIITLYRHQKAAFAITSKRGPAPKAPKAPNADLPPGSILGADNDEVQESREHDRVSAQGSANISVFVCSEQEALPDSEKRGRVVANDRRQTLWC